MIDLLNEIRQTLCNNRLRTFLTGISVAWGVFMLIILLGVTRGVTNAFEKNFSEGQENVISIWPGRTTKAYKGYSDGRSITLRGNDGYAIMRENSDVVTGVSPFASASNTTISSERDYISSSISAVFPAAEKGDRITIIGGRFINDVDVSNNRRVIVLHKSHATQLFGNTKDAIGKTVRAMDLAWTVVGIYDQDWRKQPYIPYSTYKHITGNNDKAYQLDVTIDGVTSEEEGADAEKGIVNTLAKRHDFAPDDNGAVWKWNRFTSHIAQQKSLKILEISMWVIGLLTLLTGIVGVSNIMFVSVKERTHEIGIRRAIGAKPRSILTQVITESVALTAIFGYIGIFLGMAVLQAISIVIGETREFSNPTVDIAIAVKVTIALIIAGACAGLLPALKAIKVKPVEALRDE